jgi:hypothetical protein
MEFEASPVKDLPVLLRLGGLGFTKLRVFNVLSVVGCSTFILE